MATAHSYEDPADTSPEQPSPSTAAFTETPGGALPKDGNAGWGVAARWFMLALIAVAFMVALYVIF